MSNYLAISMVTATLKYVLTQIVQTDFSAASVSMLRPDATLIGGGPRLNIYLYQVTPNAALRNDDLPTRRGDGTLVQKAKAALELHYLFSFYGDDTHFEPQRLLGILTRTLHSEPIISQSEITDAITSFIATDPVLQQSDLAAAFERVRFTPLSLTLEEMAKIWSIFYQVPYPLSVAYVASVIQIESEDTPQTALPVLTPNVYVVPFQHPEVDQVMPKTGAGQPILPTSTLVIQGSGLRGDTTFVQLGDLVVPPATVTDTEITLPIPAALPAGIQGLQVLEQLEMGTPPQLHNGIESNIVPFVLCPVLSAPVPSAAQITITVTPIARQNQRATLLLNEATTPVPPNPAAYSFSLPPLPSDTGSLTFPISGVKGATTYFIRVQIDGATSPLDLNPLSLTFGPTVTMP